MVDVFEFSQNHPFLKWDDYKDGDTFIFDNEGRHVDDKWGSHRLQMDVIMPNKEVRTITVNKTSKKNIAKKWGSDTKSWVNKAVVAKKEKLNFHGEVKDAMILYPSSPNVVWNEE